MHTLVCGVDVLDAQQNVSPVGERGSDNVK